MAASRSWQGPTRDLAAPCVGSGRFAVRRLLRAGCDSLRGPRPGSAGSGRRCLAAARGRALPGRGGIDTPGGLVSEEGRCCRSSTRLRCRDPLPVLGSVNDVLVPAPSADLVLRHCLFGVMARVVAFDSRRAGARQGVAAPLSSSPGWPWADARGGPRNLVGRRSRWLGSSTRVAARFSRSPSFTASSTSS